MGTFFGLALVMAAISSYSLKRAFPDGVALKVVGRVAWTFLALVALESVAKKHPDVGYVLLALLYIAIVLGLSYGWAHAFRGDHRGPIPIASTTFGAGNRGYAFLSALCALPVFSGRRDEIIFSFIQIDAVIVIWLIIAVPFLLSRGVSDQISTVAPPPKIVDSVKAFVDEAGLAPIVVVAVVFFGWMLPTPLLDLVREFLKPTAEARSFALLYLSMTIVFMSTKLGKRRVTELAGDLLHFYIPRVVPVIAFTFGAALIFGIRMDQVIVNHAIVLPLLVLSICPPSNYLSVLMHREPTDTDSAAQVADVNIVTTAIFFAVLALVAAPGVIYSAAAWLLNK